MKKNHEVIEEHEEKKDIPRILFKLYRDRAHIFDN